MCKFFSCLIDKKKKVYWKEGVNNHHELFELFKLDDCSGRQEEIKIARVEITPPNGDVFANIEKWMFSVDERIRPEWFSPAHEKECWKTLKLCLSSSLIINQEIDELAERKNLFIKDCKIKTITNCIVKMCDSSQVGKMSRHACYTLLNNSLAIVRVGEEIKIEYAEGAEIKVRKQ